MSGRSPVWRGILWIERFLPTPAPVVAPERASAARRRAAIVPLIVLPAIVLPAVLRGREEIGAALVANRALFGQLGLLLAGCIAIAAVASGVMAWRRTGEPR